MKTKMVFTNCVVLFVFLQFSTGFCSLHCGFEAWSADTLKCQAVGTHNNYITEGSDTLQMLHQFDWRQIRSLILKDAKISAIDPDLFVFAGQLTHLDLSGNKQLVIPDEAFNLLGNLQLLNISGLQVNFEKISNLRNLRNLCISHSGMTTKDPQFIQMMRSLRNLEVVDLSNNYLIDFTVLNVSRSLRTIDASNCEVVLADGCFRNAFNLKTLILSPSALRIVPENTFYGTTIEYINLSDNYIGEETLSSLTSSMKYVYLDRNEINAISKLWNLYDVRVLDLSLNRINYLNPKLFWQTVHLVDLNLSDNKLSSLDPETFSKISTLQTLKLSNNLLTRLPDIIFSANRDLTVLSLQGNKLKMLSPNLLSNQVELTSIDLSRNDIDYLTSQFYIHLQKLQKFDLSMNPLTRFPENVLNLPELKELRIICARLTNLPGDFPSLAKMKTQLEIALHGNPWNCACLSFITEALDNNRYAQDDFNSGTYPSCYAGSGPRICDNEPLSEDDISAWRQTLDASNAGC